MKFYEKLLLKAQGMWVIFPLPPFKFFLDVMFGLTSMLWLVTKRPSKGNPKNDILADLISSGIPSAQQAFHLEITLSEPASTKYYDVRFQHIS